MPSRDWKLRIQDILEAIAKILRITNGMTFEDLLADETLAQAVMYNFIIIGEASKNIPETIQLRYPQISWRLMGDMRNVMVHEYFQVNLEEVWETIEDEFPSLVPKLQELLDAENRRSP